MACSTCLTCFMGRMQMAQLGYTYGPLSSPPVFMLRCHRGSVRAVCALGTFLFCLTMAPVYDRIRAMVDDAGALFAFSDDAYCISSLVILKELTRSIAWSACASAGASARRNSGYQGATRWILWTSRGRAATGARFRKTSRALRRVWASLAIVGKIRS